ncbi:thioredoxin fold domain-containing protein [[Flexibacter] sp. ATCC 35208]|uniref:TlpA family protein disulfide reductase n=1 Tax=[Flexibacter] sp. ATCC 35208 TaxID=1936242 RepID=UPI0009CD5954|nr:thioredoxin fold domain-containing protein [[Flexibacter] sp. ATCC 35208]OMP80064.1 hypothetical protein BW716_06105 [[Flexibacter] sp. ATCC 35208]
MKKIIIAEFIILLIACNSHRQDVLVTGLEGQPLPTFRILSHDSTSSYYTTANRRSGATILFYYSPTCPYCRAQMKDMLQTMNRMVGVQVYAITSAPYKAMKQFYEHFELKKFSNVIAGVDTGLSVSKYYKIKSVPYTIVYGKNGKLKHVYSGQIYSSQLIAVVGR